MDEDEALLLLVVVMVVEGGEKLDPGGVNLSLSTRGSITRGSRQDCRPWHKLDEDILCCPQWKMSIKTGEERQGRNRGAQLNNLC